MVLFDAARDGFQVPGGGPFQSISDQVMGGVSSGELELAEVAGRRALRLTGMVRLENNGGFLQMAADVPAPPQAATGLRMWVWGPPETFNVHVRTTRVQRPWQSYRQPFETDGTWREVRLPWSGFTAHRIEAPFRASEVRRLGLVGIGRPFTVDLALARVEWWVG